MKALILAAGYAVRLYPLTKKYPKPLLKVNKKPIIDYIVGKLEDIEEIDEIIVVTNSKFTSLFKKWIKKSGFKKRISLVDDLTKSPEDRRGAIGDIDFAVNKKRIKDDLLVIGGDNLFDESLDEFLSFAKTGDARNLVGVFDIKAKRRATKYGVVRLSRTNKIVEFKEKPKDPKSTLVAMCLYYFPKDKLRLIKQYLKSKAGKFDATGFYIEWLRKVDAVYGFIFSGKWFDIGDKKFYNQAKTTF